MKKILAALCLTSLLGLAGCGNTGPLYMPEDGNQTKTTQS
ncbi:LPS translocon maturation chaperone LptM [Vibrio hannami]